MPTTKSFEIYNYCFVRLQDVHLDDVVLSGEAAALLYENFRMQKKLFELPLAVFNSLNLQALPWTQDSFDRSKAQFEKDCPTDERTVAVKRRIE